MVKDIQFNDSSKYEIIDANSNMYDIICQTSSTELLSARKQYIEIERDFAVFVTSALEGKMNENFHNSLSKLEKHGIISEEKIINHQKKVSLMKGIVGGSITLAFEIAPLISHYIKENNTKLNTGEFIVGWTSYINGENYNKNLSSVQGLIDKMNINLSSSKIERIAEKYSNYSQNSIVDHLRINKTYLNDVADEDLLLIAKKIALMCDLSDSSSYDRTMEFLEYGLSISHTKAEKIIEETKSTETICSKAINFSSVSFTTFLKPLITSLESAQKFAYCDIDCDAFSSLREKRKDDISKTIDLDAVKILNQISPELADISITISKARRILNPHGNPETAMYIAKLKKLLTYSLNNI